VRTWDAHTGEALATYAPGVGPVRSLASAPDGLTAAAGGTAGRVAVWDVEV
jgi:WD40 repeat protein